MGVASIVGLLLPALDEGSAAAAIAGLVRASPSWRYPARPEGRDVHVGRLRGAGVRRSVLVFAVLFVHSLPEGLAMGTAGASEPGGSALFVILAIALQNVPEGTSVAIPMEAAGFGRGAQFWAAVATSAPAGRRRGFGDVLVEQVTALLPFSFAFAAGAMLALVAVELVPQAFARPRAPRSCRRLGGALLMLALSAASACRDTTPARAPARSSPRRLEVSPRPAPAVLIGSRPFVPVDVRDRLLQRPGPPGAGWRGTRAASPPAGEDLAESPPTSSSLSRMPTTPKPPLATRGVEPRPSSVTEMATPVVRLDGHGDRSARACFPIGQRLLEDAIDGALDVDSRRSPRWMSASISA